MFITKLQFTDAELAEKQQEFNELTKTFDNRISIWKELHVFFVTKKFAELQDYQLSYWRWYVDLSWRHLEKMELDTVINDVFARQVPMALLLNYDVLEKMMWYFSLRVFDPAQLQSVYDQCRRSFMESEFPMGMWQKKVVLIKDLVAEMNLMNSRGNNSLEEANFRSKLQQLFFPKNPLFEKFVFSNPDDVIERFIDFVNFFFGVKAERIWYVVEGFIHPDTYDMEIKNPVVVADADLESESEPVASTEKNEQPEVPTYQQIKDQMESTLSKDASGQFLDPGAVFNMLGALAERYADDKIVDLYYFSETDGKFHWNDELLAR